MRLAWGFFLVFALTVAPSASAETVTIATFEDPSEDSSTPLFTYDATADLLTGGWTLGGLTLETIGGVFENATFSMAAAPGDAAHAVGPGTIDFRDDADSLILSIAFDSAELTIVGFGATEFMALNDISFSGPILTLPAKAESFSFPFSNQESIGNDGSFSATAAFTSSAEIIPEPVTLTLLLLAGGWVAWSTRSVAMIATTRLRMVDSWSCLHTCGPHCPASARRVADTTTRYTLTL